jgi:hypothetical protein
LPLFRAPVKSQMVASSVVLLAGWRLTIVSSHALGFIVTIFFVLALTNAMNFFDGSDGLAAGVALIVAALFAFLPGISLTPPSKTFAWSIAGASASFLCWNFTPAKLFLGDGGSTVTGILRARPSEFACPGSEPFRVSIVCCGTSSARSHFRRHPSHSGWPFNFPGRPPSSLRLASRPQLVDTPGGDCVLCGYDFVGHGRLARLASGTDGLDRRFGSGFGGNCLGREPARRVMGADRLPRIASEEFQLDRGGNPA